VAAFCLLRMGAPHCGHAALVEAMLDVESAGERCVVLVGSADVSDRPDTPLSWEERRDLLLALLRHRSAAVARLAFAPLPELETDGWDARWCAYLLETARRAAAPAPLTRYVFGSDYDEDGFAALAAQAPSLALMRIPRRYDKSSRELRIAITHHDPRLLEKYEEELRFYDARLRKRIARTCAHGVDRP
jgi:hypothetical protein